ncbi:hypothetical protein V2O64_06295 [Verrucomicrobiaceae bacterium 227]
MKTSLTLLGLLMGSLQGEVVLWRATGNITSTSGSFVDPSLAPGEAVTIRMTYDDQTAEVIEKSTVGDIESDFRTEIDLTVTVQIGTRKWQAHVFSGGSLSPATFYTKIRNFSTSPESVTATVDSRDNGTFASFPFGPNDETRSIKLDFLGPKTFIGTGIESREIDPSVITTASGAIQSGSSQLKFEITPSSVEILNLAQEPVSPKINFSTPGNQFLIEWRSSPFFTYRIERSFTLDDNGWMEVETINGTGAAFSRQYLRGDSPEFYRIVTDSKTP